MDDGWNINKNMYNIVVGRVRNYGEPEYYNFAREYEDLLEWFDRWVVADVDPESSTLKFKIRPAAEKHVETIYW